jgi:hypothetical protein
MVMPMVLCGWSRASFSMPRSSSADQPISTFQMIRPAISQCKMTATVE